MCKNAILEQLVTIYNKSAFSSNDIAAIISCSQNDNPELTSSMCGIATRRSSTTTAAFPTRSKDCSTRLKKISVATG